MSGEVCLRQNSEFVVQLDRGYSPRRPDQVSHDGGVVASTRAYIDDVLAGLEGRMGKQCACKEG